MGKIFRFGSVFLLMTLNSGWGASIDLVQEYSFEIPMTDTIRQIAFGDIDNDGTPEVFARTDHAFALYSILNDSILFQQSYSSDTFVTYVMIGDVNRDHVKDVVVGRSYSNQIDSFFFEISAWSGLPGNQFLGDFSYDIGGGAVQPEYGKIYFVKSVDINRDGTDEVLFSFDQGHWNQDFSEEQSTGYSWLFHSFPDSILWGKSVGFSSQLTFADGSDSTRVLVTPRTYWGIYHQGWGSSDEHIKTELLSEDGTSALLADYFPDRWWDYFCMSPDFWQLSISPKCVGSISGNSQTREYVAQVDARFGCYPALIQGRHETQLRRFRSDGTNAILYTLQDVYGYFAYHPLLPGYFLELGSVYNDFYTRARLFRGVDGKELARSIPINLSPRWVTDFPDEIPMVIVKNVNQLTISSLQISTDVATPNSDTVLPSNFTLSRPYPNPFNAEVSIPLSLPRRAYVRVDIYNLLGQRIAELWNGPMNAGEQVIRWNAGQLPSAVYFVKVTALGETKTAKVVLLK